MKIRKTLKYRFYNNRRNKALARQIDIAGIIWNHLLALQRRYYRLTGKYISKYRMKKHIAKLRRRHPKYQFWALLGSQAVQDVSLRQDAAWQKFFAYKAGKGPKAGRPHFKKVKKYTSFTLTQAGWEYLGNNKVRIGRYIYKFSLSRVVEGEIKTLTIKRDNLGRFWICFSVIREVEPVEFSSGKIGGFDFGLKTFLTDDQGSKYIHPLFFKANLSKIARFNRELSRKKKGSNNYQRAKFRLTRAHKRLANKRRDFHYKLANRLIAEFDIMYFEDLNIKAMQKLWGRKISDLGFASFMAILESNAKQSSRTVQKIDRWEPTSQVCSECGCTQKMELSERIYDCPKCDLVLDRDINAARNILLAGASANGLGDVRRAKLAVAA